MPPPVIVGSISSAVPAVVTLTVCVMPPRERVPLPLIADVPLERPAMPAPELAAVLMPVTALEDNARFAPLLRVIEPEPLLVLLELKPR